MVVRRGRLPSAALEALNLFSRFDSPTSGTNTTVRDPARRQDFQELISAALDQSLDNESRLHGWRVQGLFEAMIVCLGGIRLIKEEDTGNYYFDDASGDIKLPDFRIVRTDGEHLLVEVKGVGPKDMVKPQRVRAQDLEQQLRYAELTGARLVLAHYWSALNRWTVVDPNALEHRDSQVLLPIEAAIKANELGLLGDAQIGTEPPLVFSLLADASQQTRRTLGADEQQIGFTVGEVEFASAGRILTDPVEQRIAWFLMLHGSWDTTEEPEIENGRLVKVKFVCVPPGADDDQAAEAIARQGCADVGSLSSMYSTLYNEATLTDTGELRSLRHEPDPGSLAALIPADYWNRTTRDLPIWKFRVRPNDDGTQERTNAR